MKPWGQLLLAIGARVYSDLLTLHALLTKVVSGWIERLNRWVESS